MHIHKAKNVVGGNPAFQTEVVVSLSWEESMEKPVSQGHMINLSRTRKTWIKFGPGFFQKKLQHMTAASNIFNILLIFYPSPFPKSIYLCIHLVSPL